MARLGHPAFHMSVRFEAEIVPIGAEHQADARRLILAGLAERWGTIDATLNPDLDDIATTFETGAFLVALRSGVVVGTGGLLPHGASAAEIVRVSVAPDERRDGLGRRIVMELVDIARTRDVERVVCETTSTWASAVQLYLQCGFSITHTDEGDTYFERRLD